MSSIRASNRESTEPIGLARWAKEKLLSQNQNHKRHSFDTKTSLPTETPPVPLQLEQHCDSQKHNFSEEVLMSCYGHDFDGNKEEQEGGEAESDSNMLEKTNDHDQNSKESPVVGGSVLSALSALTLDTEGKRPNEEGGEEVVIVDGTKKPRLEILKRREPIRTLEGKLQCVLDNGGLRFVYVHCKPPATDHYLVAIDNPQDVKADAAPTTTNLTGDDIFNTRFWKDSCLSTQAIQLLLKNNGFVKMTNFTVTNDKHIKAGKKYWTISMNDAKKFYDPAFDIKWIEATVFDSGMASNGKGPVRASLTFSEEMDENVQVAMDESQVAIQNMACIRSAERFAWSASMGEENPIRVDLGLLIPPSMDFGLERMLENALDNGSNNDDFEKIVDDFDNIVDDMSLPLPLPLPLPPPVPNVYLAADAQLASLIRRGEEPTPQADEFDPYVDWHLSDNYTKIADRYKANERVDDDTVVEALKPMDNFYITKTKAWKEYSVPGQWYQKQKDFFLADIVEKEQWRFAGPPTERVLRWGVQADDPDQNGFFSSAALQKIYDHMIVKGRVMFSVLDGTPDEPGKAIQFFPEKYVCSSVPWWSSKLDYLPQTLIFEDEASGSYNTVERLNNLYTVVAFSVIVEGPNSDDAREWDTIKRQVVNFQKNKLDKIPKSNVMKFSNIEFLDAQVIMQTSHMTLAYKPVPGPQIAQRIQKLIEELTLELSRDASEWVGHKVTRVTDQPKALTAPDVRFFLPDFGLAYGLETGDPRIEEIHANANKWGLVLRKGYSEVDATFEGPLREAMLSSLAASNGFGPRIFAQWIVPEEAHNYQMYMNTNETCSHFSDGLFEATRLDANDKKFDKYCIPSQPWCKRKNWTLDHSIAETSALIMPSLHKTAYDNGLQWKSTCTLMEGFEGDVFHLTMEHRHQYQLFIDAVYEQCERMSQAGILHGDIKLGNSVYRTTKTDDAIPEMKSWDKIEIRFIDFDPYYCKLVPFVPTEVLTLVNFAMYMTSAACRHEDWHLSEYALPKVNELLENINNKYNKNESPFAVAFLALGPTYRRFKVPESIVEKDGYETYQPDPPRRSNEYILYNDEWEMARMFRYNVAHYFENGCGGRYRNSKNYKHLPMIARMLSFIEQENQGLTRDYADRLPGSEDESKDLTAS